MKGEKKELSFFSGEDNTKKLEEDSSIYFDQKVLFCFLNLDKKEGPLKLLSQKKV